MRRSLARSLLIAALVAVPVAGATMMDVLVRSSDAPERRAQQAMGSADAQLTVTSMRQISDWTPAPWSDVGGRRERNPDTVDVAALLPRGTRLVREPPHQEMTFSAGRRVARTPTVVADVNEPLLRHEARLIEGRTPTHPDEVLLAPATADRLDVGLGMTIAPGGGPTLNVVGLVREPSCFTCERVVAAPGSTLAQLAKRNGPLSGSDADGQPMYLVDLPDGVDATTLWQGLREHGLALTPRDTWLHAEDYVPAGGGAPTVDELRAAALVAVIVGVGLLEIVLLAGTAFAVGARRQTRELGLVAASGGSARHVRRIVLAQGLVLGTLGAIGGVALGAALTVAGRPLWERLEGAELVVWAFGPWEILGAALIGLLSGLAAAIVPAIGAGRMRPVDALAERFRTTRATRRRTAAIGALLLVAGVVCGIAGDRLIADDFAEYARSLETVREGGGYLAEPSPTGPIALIVGGAMLLLAALVVLAPRAIGRLAAVGGHLPLSLRLAVRDASRHRHRTGPATSAIAVAVAGSVVLAFLLAGQFHADEVRYVPYLPPHVMAVELDGDDAGTARQAATRAAAELPGGRAYALRQPLRPLAQDEQLPVGSNEAQLREMYPAPPPGREDVAVSGVAIAGKAELNAVATGRPLDAAARRALAAGKALVFDKELLWDDGRVVIDVGDEELHKVPLAAHVVEPVVDYIELPSLLVPPAVVRAQHWDTGVSRMLVRYDAGATPDELDAARNAAERFGVSAYVEEGPNTPADGALLAAAAIAAFVTLVGVAISVALSAAEGRADLATLAAVGAPPRRRRALAAGQALLIAGVGCVAGITFGGFVAFTARATTGSPDFVVPWLNLAVTGIVVPLLAVLVVTVFTPSRLPMVRRAT